MTQEVLTPAERFDTLVEVGISRLVTTDEASDKRQDMREIQVIAPADEFIRRVRELQDCDLSAGSQDAVHLAKTSIEVGEVAASEGAGDAVKRGVVKRHGLGVGVEEIYIGDFKFMIYDFLLADTHHLA